MMTYRPSTLFRALALVLLFSLFAIAAACSSGDGSNDTPAVGESPSAGDMVDGEDDGAEDGDADSGAGDDLTALFDAWFHTQAKIAYDYTTTGGVVNDSGVLTLYWLPPDWRMDVTVGASQQSFIQAGDTFYLCSEGVCQSFSGLGEIPPPVPFVGLFTSPDALTTSFASAFTGVNYDTSSDTIAGQSAECFSASGLAGGASGGGEWCWSENGLLLRARSTSSGASGDIDFVLEATSVEDISADDLEPPFPVQEFAIPTFGIPETQ